MLPKSRKTGAWRKPTKSKSITDRSINRANRYSGINKKSLHTHRTIEVRMHSATLDHTKISNWIKILTHIVDAEMNRPTATRSLGDLSNWTKIQGELLGYMRQRIMKFNPEKITRKKRVVTEEEVPF